MIMVILVNRPLRKFVCMKSAIASLLIFVSTIPILGNLALLADYYVHLEIYKIECINKAKPELKCDGKCHLKEFASIENANTTQQEPVAPTLKTLPEILLFNQLVSTEQKSSSQLINIPKHINYFFSCIENQYFELFVPPKIFSF